MFRKAGIQVCVEVQTSGDPLPKKVRDYSLWLDIQHPFKLHITFLTKPVCRKLSHIFQGPAPFMIWGWGRRKSEKKNGGPSPGKKN